MKKQTITRDSKDEAKFLNELKDRIGCIDISHIPNTMELEWIA